MLLVLLLIYMVAQANCTPALTGAGCATCTGQGDSQTCLTCNPLANKVQPGGKKCGDGCPANSTPKGNLCECNGGYRPNAEQGQCISSSVNKSGGLSTGAIAGISVAVVIVVGGLVGFLCWWFLCRGKA
ncbi:VSP [Giardia lamblia P15]|uniref:VSP n=1 Tax=Giardia intestinalis (strain P15) TaxID=658858 RepID=E1F9H3_GIAIA|nr:VSP [Giardia lamblia P15]